MIKVGKKFIITADTHGFTAKRLNGKTINKKTGEEYDAIITVGYYGTIEGCLEGMARYTLREKVRCEKDIDFKNLASEVRAINKEFTDLLKGIPTDIKLEGGKDDGRGDN